MIAVPTNEKIKHSLMATYYINKLVNYFSILYSLYATPTKNSAFY